MLHHVVSRRDFLKWSGITLAGTWLRAGHVPGFSFVRAAPADAGSLALQINGDGVIFGGPVLVAPTDVGGVSIFHNLSLIINDSGFQGFFEGGGYVSFEGLSQQESRVENGAWIFRGRLGHDNLWMEQKIFPSSGSVEFDISLTGSGLSARRPELVEGLRGATFSFFLPAAIFRGQTYVADGQAGTYPSQVPSDARLLAGFRQIELYQDNPALNYRLDAPTEMTLWDGRAWGDPRYQIAVQIPVDTGRAQFTLTPPALDPGPNPPSVRFSRVGYLPDSEKRAVLDIDWRDDWPADMSARLERKAAGGQAETVLGGSFVIDGDECWRRFASFDFSSITETGEYRVNWAGGQTDWFPIAPNIFNGRWYATLDKFLPLQMCHIAVDLGDGLLAHGACHLDDAVQVPPNYFGADGYVAYESSGTPASPGETIVCNVGGWHDAGDYDVNVTAQAFVTHILALAWEEFAPTRDVNTLDLEGRQMRIGQSNGVPDLLEQVEWGVRWLLSMQQADGRVYVGVVTRPEAYNSKQLPEDVTDGVPDTGDERDLFVDYHSDAQLKFIIATAAASRALRGTNDTLAEAAWQAALRAWSYFQANPEVYRSTVYFSYEPGLPGREGMIIAAAAELYLTDPDPSYLNAISQYESYLQELAVLWPAPYITDYPGFWYVPPFLARLFPQLPDGSLKNAVAQAVGRAADALRATAAERPFPHHCWDAGKFGSNWQLLSRVYDAYWLSQAAPERIAVRDALPGVYWLFGLHPANDLTFVLGTEFPSPQYMSDSILWARFGDQPAVKPGAMVPGLGKYQPAGIFFYLDNPWAIFNNESGIHDAPKLIFAMLALRQKYLPEDLDRDGDVDVQDIQLIANQWQCAGDCPPGYDQNGDGVVDIRDVQRIAAAWGS